MYRKTFSQMLCVYLVLALAVVTLPSEGWAMFMPTGQANTMDAADRAVIQKALESTMVQQRLTDLGLSKEEAMARINSLSDEQIHQFASRLESIQAGGDAAGTVLAIVLIVAIVVVVLELTGHSIFVR